jgi:hypothetical protein
VADPIADPSTALAARLSRRDALKTYAPPALAVVAVANVQTFGTSGRVKVEHPNSGRGNGPEGDPDPDPGNSGGHNNGGDGAVPPPDAGNPHGGGDPVGRSTGEPGAKIAPNPKGGSKK